MNLCSISIYLLIYIFVRHGRKSAIFAVDVPFANFATSGAVLPKLGAFQPTLNPGGAVNTQGSVPPSFNQQGQASPTAIQLIVDNKFSTHQYVYKSQNGIDTYTANNQFVFTDVFEGGRPVWSSGGGQPGKQFIVNTAVAGPSRYRMVFDSASSDSTDAGDQRLGTGAGGVQQPQTFPSGPNQVVLPQRPTDPTSGRRLAVSSFTEPGQVYAPDHLGKSHQNFAANLHFVTMTGGAQNVDDSSQYNIFTGKDGYIYNFNDQAQCVEIKFVNNTMWKIGETRDYPTKVEFSLSSPPHVLIATKNQTYTYRLVNRKWQLGSHTTNVASKMDPAHVKIEIANDATCAQTFTDESKYTIKTFDELNIFYYEFFPNVFCAGVIYQNQYLWKYASNFGNYFPKRIYFHKDVMMVVVDFPTFYLVYKFDNMWKFDSQVIKDFHEDQLELVTYDSQNNTANVNDASQYRVIEHYYLRQYKFIPSSMCISLRYQQKPVWVRSNQFQNYFPKSIVYNIKTRNFFVDFDQKWYYVYVFDQNADKWYLVHKDEANKPPNLPSIETEEGSSQQNSSQDPNSMQSRTFFFGQNNPQEANKMVDLSRMSQNEGQFFSDSDSRPRRGRSGQMITSVIKQVSLDDGSEMEVEEVMSDVEVSRRRKGDRGRSVAPLETDNEGAARSSRGPQAAGVPLLSPGSPSSVKAKSTVKNVSLSDGSEMEVEEVMSDVEVSRRRKGDRGRSVAPLETDNEGAAPRSARSQPLEIPLQSDNEGAVTRMARSKASAPLETDNEAPSPRASRSHPLEIPLQSDNEAGVSRMARAKTSFPLETDNEGSVSRMARAKTSVPLETDNEGSPRSAGRGKALEVPLESDNEAAVSRMARARTSIPLETDNEGAVSRMARAKTSVQLETDNESNAPRSARGKTMDVPLESDNEAAVSRMARAKTAIPLETDNEGNAPRTARRQSTDVPLHSDIEGAVSRMARASKAFPLETDNESNVPRTARRQSTDLPLQSDNEGHAPRTARGSPMQIPLHSDLEGGVARLVRAKTTIPLDTDNEAAPRTMSSQPRLVRLETESDGMPRRKSVLSIPLESEAEGDKSKSGQYRVAGQGMDSHVEVSDSRPATSPHAPPASAYYAAPDIEIMDPRVPKTVVEGPHVQDVPLSSFSEDESRERIDDNLIILDVNNRRGTDIVKHRYDHRRKADIFSTKRPYLFYMVKQGLDTVWYSKDGNYPDKVVVKTDEYGNPKFRVFFPLYDPKSKDHRKAKYAESFDSELERFRSRDTHTHAKHHREHARAERHRPADKHYHKQRDSFHFKKHDRHRDFPPDWHRDFPPHRHRDYPPDRRKPYKSYEPSSSDYREFRDLREPSRPVYDEKSLEQYDPSQPFKIQYDYDEGKVAGVRCNGVTIWRRQSDDPYPQSAKFFSDILMISIIFNKNHFHIYKFNGYAWKRIRASVERIVDLDVFSKGSSDTYLYSSKNHVDTYMAMDRFLFNKVKLTYMDKYRCLATDIWATDNPTDYAYKVVVNRFGLLSTKTEVTIYFINGCQVTYSRSSLLKPFAKVRWSETASELSEALEVYTMDNFGNYEINNHNRFDIFAHWKVGSPGSNIKGIYKYEVVFYQNARCTKVRHKKRKLWDVDPQLSGYSPTKITFNFETNTYYFEFADDVYNFVIEDKTPSYY